VQYPPEAIAAALQNAAKHAGSRWRIVPLWILKVCQDNPMVPRIYLAAFGGIIALALVVQLISALFGHHQPSPSTQVP
jgi:hypothetical protein